jgi:HD-GYP domain-containing protein (c-di-GMP phosphodiesterase class II)
MIPENLKIENENLRICLESVSVAVEKFWDPPLLQQYTKHGPDHSKRVIKVLGNLLEDYSDRLNDYERFILIASAYLHDIGMQSPQHAGLLRKPEYAAEEMEIIRKRHNEASAKMINESVSDASSINLGLGRCKDLANYVALVLWNNSFKFY